MMCFVIGGRVWPRDEGGLLVGLRRRDAFPTPAELQLTAGHDLNKIMYNKGKLWLNQGFF